MPLPAPTSAPPSFYDSLPSGGAAAPTPQKNEESDTDGEVLKALTGCYRVLGKVAKLKDSLKPDIQKIKDDLKNLVVRGLKKDPSELEGGEDTQTATTPASPGSVSPKTSDETHAA